MSKQSALNNEKAKNYNYLSDMYADSYFPTFLVDKCKDILIELCINIEAQIPKNLDELYALTNIATEKINDLQDEFYKNESEIETVARDCLATDFENIANIYGFANADIEELVAERDW